MKRKFNDRVINTSSKKFDGEGAREVVMSGKLNIGRGGSPVTVTVKDEVSGETMEISNVGNALLMIEEKRRSSGGWMSLIFGDVKKIGEVLEFLSKMTLSGLKNMKL